MSLAGVLTADQGNFVPQLYQKKAGERKNKTVIELYEFHLVKVRSVKSCQ